MTKERDPLGKRALFSGGPAEGPTTQARNHGAFDLTLHCSSCDATTVVGPALFVLQRIPVSVWLPWRKHGHLMRCPACGALSWLSATRAG